MNCEYLRILEHTVFEKGFSFKDEKVLGQSGNACGSGRNGFEVVHHNKNFSKSLSKNTARVPPQYSKMH
jgi:hypothetical protein